MKYLHHLSLTAIIAVIAALPAQALTLEQCTRTTHISHGGEADHRDLGAGRVMWRDWWSQEGTATDFIIMECATGAALEFRAAATNMVPGQSAFDRTDAALAVLERHESGARVFATFDRIAVDLQRIARDISQTIHETESCACAALYPSNRGNKAPFVLVDITDR